MKVIGYCRWSGCKSASRMAGKPRNNPWSEAREDGTADFVDLLGPFVLLRSRLHYDAMFSGHVVLHRHHTPGHVSIIITKHCHTVMLTNMIVQHGVIRHPELTEGTEPHRDLVYSVGAHLAALLQHFSVCRPQRPIKHV